MKPGVKVRSSAAKTIAAVMSGESLDKALEVQLKLIPERDHALCRELCYGTLRFFHRLDALLNLLLDKPLRAKDREVHALALLGLYQLEGMRIPEHAAVSATVDAATALGRRRMAGMLNAVLRRFQREAQTLTSTLSASAAQAHPVWLWDELEAQWPAQRDQIISANNSRPPMSLRVNLSKTDRDSYLASLEQVGIEATAGRLCPTAITLAQAADVEILPGFRDGLCSVQDEAAQMAAVLLSPKPGERILDACAAPGGKSGHLLEVAPGCELTAMDISQARLQRVKDNHERLGQAVSILCADGARPPTALRAASGFDAILLDAPCSATGVIRRHPDVKLLRRDTDIASFATQQDALLIGLWPLLVPGGRLLYVTCSVLDGENSEVVERFLAAHNDALHEPLTLTCGYARKLGRQLLPDPDGGDGLYFALLRKAL